MSLAMARRAADLWSESLGGSTPGESRRSRSPPMRTQRRLRVTPGRGALAHALVLVRRLMSADLPTLGYPMTAVRTGRGCSPLARRLSLTSLLTSSATSFTRLTPLPLRASVSTTCSSPLFLNQATHLERSASLTISARLSTSTRSLVPIHDGMSGCVVASGMRMSRTSTMASTAFNCSRRSFSARAMCPGYHCTSRTCCAMREGRSASASSAASSSAVSCAALHRNARRPVTLRYPTRHPDNPDTAAPFPLTRTSRDDPNALVGREVDSRAVKVPLLRPLPLGFAENATDDGPRRTAAAQKP
mmetsp:Transcript_6704/g.10292  ORF Transcript_6704/g.10292 Transcript_6704/m.10292 type:complete len:303 (+) Transcript_6704:975-1883(+)